MPSLDPAAWGPAGTVAAGALAALAVLALLRRTRRIALVATLAAAVVLAASWARANGLLPEALAAVPLPSWPLAP